MCMYLFYNRIKYDKDLFENHRHTSTTRENPQAKANTFIKYFHKINF